MTQPRAMSLRALIATPAAWVYSRIIGARNARFDAGRGVRRLDRPVISIGNLTVGGTGKSPMVRWACQQLRDAGHQPVIAMRGYGAPPGGRNDEQLEYEWRIPDVPVIADPDRHAALSAFLADHPAFNCVVLDDGFQHRQLHRDLDIVLIDASAATFAQRLLPAGRLREPVAALARADAVVVTRASRVDETLAQQIVASHGHPPVAWSNHHWQRLLVIDKGNQRHEPVRWLAGRRVLTMLGVGHPTSIERQIEQADAAIAARIPVRDHQRYDRARLLTARGLCDGVDAMVVTAKDWVKIHPLIHSMNWPSPIVVPELALDVHHGADELRRLLVHAASRADSGA